MSVKKTINYIFSFRYLREGADAVVLRTQTKIWSNSIFEIKLFCTGIPYTHKNLRLPLKIDVSPMALWT